LNYLEQETLNGETNMKNSQKPNAKEAVSLNRLLYGILP